MKKLFCILFMIWTVCASAQSVTDTIPADSLVRQDFEQPDCAEDVLSGVSLQEDTHSVPFAPDDRLPVIVLFVILTAFMVVLLLSYYDIEPYWLQIIGFISGILLLLSPMWLYWCYNGF